MDKEYPAIVILVIDSLRYGSVPGAPYSPHLAATGLPRPSLPSFERLVSGAFHFTQAVACAPHTPAAIGSLLTGLLPPEHGIRAHAATSLSPGVRTLADILGEVGYRTCAMTDYPEVLERVGLLRDFQALAKDEEEAWAWWDGNRSQPRFLLLHMWDAHKPYGMPIHSSQRGTYAARLAAWQAQADEHGVRLPADLGNQAHSEVERHKVNVIQCLLEQKLGWQAGLAYYLDGLRDFDSGRLSRLVAACHDRDVLANSLFVVTADHGDGRAFDGYGRLSHASNLLDDVIRIPLFVRLPHDALGHQIHATVSQADILPTLLDLVGTPHLRTEPRTSECGRSLLPLLRGRKMKEMAAYAELSLARPTTRRDWPEDTPSSVVRYRMLRLPNCKYLLTGSTFALTRQIIDAPADLFLRELYRGLLGRFEDGEGFAAWMHRLADADTRPDRETVRRAVARGFAQTLEAGPIPKYAIYDLQQDPMEQKPQTPASRRLFWLRYRPHLQQMLAIAGRARPGAPLLRYDTADEIIRQRLAALGYIE